jgi:hypothetical protein
MHQQAFEWIAAQVARSARPAPSVLEIGSLDINGSVRPLFPGASHYHGLDLVAGDGVDEVADAATWTPPRTYDVVVSAEVLEHAPAWRANHTMMWAATAPGGLLFMTCAADPRAPHSAVDGWDVRDGEYYANVGAADVRSLIAGWDAPDWSVERAADRGDLYLRVAHP